MLTSDYFHRVNNLGLQQKQSLLTPDIHPTPEQSDYRTRLLATVERMLDRVDSLQGMVQDLAIELFSSQRIYQLLRWAGQVASCAEDELNPCGKRAEAISLALERASQLAFSQVRGQSKDLNMECAQNLRTAARSAHQIASRLDTNLNRSEGLSAGRSFVTQVTETWYSGEFDPYLLMFTQSETCALRDYLGMNNLIVQCYDLYLVPTDRWRTFQHHMFRLDEL